MNNYNKKSSSRKGGYIADYNTVSTPNDYMLYIPPAASINPATSSSEGAVLVSNNSTPGLTNGMIKGGSSKVTLPNGFLYSMYGGCALCNSSTSYKGGYNSCEKNKGGNYKKNLKGGFGLEPFITALALLGARMLADKEVGLFNNKKSTGRNSKYEDEED